MSKTDPGIFKLLDDMRISSERILAKKAFHHRGGCGFLVQEIP